jgi:hypothetical protein
MKTPAYLTYSLRFIMVFALVLLLGSCQKTVKMQTFNDVFDISGIETLNSQLALAKTVADLPAEIGEVNFAVPEGMKNITPAEIANWYEKNIKLSNAEVDMLLKNDSKTYIDVINRMASLPPEMGIITADDFKALKNSDLNKYLLKQIDQPENFYSTDYYSAIIALQNYIKVAVIEPMNLVSSIADAGNKPPIILGYKIITRNNIWDMWWVYWGDGTRTKHKGAAGSYPGPLP